MLERVKDTTKTLVDELEEVRRRRTGPILLELDLTRPLVDGIPNDPISAVAARRRTQLRAVVDGLRRATSDDRVKALVVKVGGSRSPLGLARAQELRTAIVDFRRSGKPAVAWAETFGEAGRGTVPYYLAAAFDEIWLQPSGDVCVTGVAIQTPFLRDALDNVGISVQVAQRHEYKNVANLFTERQYTDTHREAIQRVVDSAMECVMADIAAGRRLDSGEVRSLVDQAPLVASEALANGLVDRLGYRDEVYHDVRTRAGSEVALQYVGRYARTRRAGRGASSRSAAVALIHVNGGIHLGPSGRRPFAGGGAGSDSVTAALRAAVKAHDVKAVVLRVTSPGGSYVASDAIWRQVDVVRQAGKPVVVSMGEVAASGGYFVSMGADTIIAEPGTITGSIGVVGGKPVADHLAARMGIGHDEATGGAHALMFSPLRPFGDDEWARFNAWLDRIYGDFVAKVARGRRLAPERVDEVARGRVWTGADAKDRGLVDELGGLALAVAIARDRGGLPPATEPEVRLYPRRSIVARLTPAQSSEHEAAAHLSAADAWGAFAGLAGALGLPASGPLTLVGDWTLR
jgi:protease IV